jgi:iron(III) transport system permease protein
MLARYRALIRAGGCTPRPVLLVILFLFTVCITLYPIALLFVRSFQVNRLGEPVVWGLASWTGAFSDPSVWPALANTLALALVRTVISTALAMFFAWVVTRTDTPLRGTIERVLVLGFFLPVLPITMGWILLLDPHVGLINRLVMNVLGAETAPFNIFSYGGIVWVHLPFSTSIRFLVLAPAFRALDATLEEAASTAGSSGLRMLTRITIPLLAPAIVAATALGFVKSFESFEIEMVLGIPAGIPVYSTKIWDYLHSEPTRYGEASALSVVFLVIILMMVGMQHVLLGRRTYATISGRGYAVRPVSLGRWRWVTLGMSLTFVAVMIVLPVCLLVAGTFMKVFGFFDIPDPWTLSNWTQVFADATFTRSLLNTLILGIGAGVIGTLFYAVVSYLLVRDRFRGRSVLELLTWLPWAYPGVLLGLALLWTFLGAGGVFGMLYGTVALLILSMIIKELPLGIQVLRVGVLQIERELEEAAAVAGAPWVQTFRRVTMPLLRPSMMAVGLLVFIAAVREIPTTVFLASFESRTISLLMLDYMSEGKYAQASVIGTLLTTIVVLVALASRAHWMRVGPVAWSRPSAEYVQQPERTTRQGHAEPALTSRTSASVATVTWNQSPPRKEATSVERE